MGIDRHFAHDRGEAEGRAELLAELRRIVPADLEIGRPSQDAGKLSEIHTLLWGKEETDD